MDLNHVLSNFEILGNSVTKLEIENDLFYIPDVVEKTFGMDIELVELEKKSPYFYGEIIVSIEIDVLSESEGKTHICMDVHGSFQSPESEVNQEEFTKLLLINGAAALYTIARSKMEVVSSLIYSRGRLTLPFVNIVNFYQEKFASKTSK